MLSVNHNITLKRSFFKLIMGFTFRISLKKKKKTKKPRSMLFSTSWDENSVNPQTPASLLFLTQTGVPFFNHDEQDPQGCQGRGLQWGTEGPSLGVSAVGRRCLPGPHRPKVKSQLRHPEVLLPWTICLILLSYNFLWEKQYWIYSTVLRIKWGYDYKVVSIVHNKK